MSSTNKTANFKLSQFIGTDKPTFLGDYNNDMDIIDAALFTASQTAEEAVNDVENVKAAQTEIKAVHEDTRKQVEQLKETADGMTGAVTAAQEAANSAEQKATEAQNAATGVLNAANTASANATKAKQTADGNKTTLQELDQRVTALEGKPDVPAVVPTTIELSALSIGEGKGGRGGITFNDNKFTTLQVIAKNTNQYCSLSVRGRNTESESWTNLGGFSGTADVPSPEINLQNKKILSIELNINDNPSYGPKSVTFTLK